MENQILKTVLQIKSQFGESAFSNSVRLNNLLKDLAPDNAKERVQIRNLIEMDAYGQLKNAGENYLVTRNRIIAMYVENYLVEKAAAAWGVDLLAAMLGYIEEEAFLNRTEDQAIGAAAAIMPVFTGNRQVIAAGMYHSVLLRRNGTVAAFGNNEAGQCNVDGWRDIVSVAAGSFHTLGVRADGTVVAAGAYDDGQCRVNKWEDIVAVCASSRHSVGLTADGTVVAAGRNHAKQCDVSHWRGIKAVWADFTCTYGALEDGSLLVKGDLLCDRHSFAELKNIKQVVSAEHDGLFALMNDGHARYVRGDSIRSKMDSDILAGFNENLNTAELVEIARAKEFFFGLTKTGKIIFWRTRAGTGANTGDMARIAAGFEDIAAIAACNHHIVALQKDGRAKAVMLTANTNENDGQCGIPPQEGYGCVNG